MTMKFYDLSGSNGRRFSPFGWRVRMALAHKGLEQNAEVELVRFSDKEKLKFSGQSLVPVIVDGTTVVSDSWAIARYLEKTYPDTPSLFGSPVGEAAARFVSTWVDSQIHPLVARCVVADILKVIDAEDRAYFRRSREERFGMTLEDIVTNRDETKKKIKMTLYPVRKTVEERPFLGGETACFSDYAVFGAFMWAKVVSPFKIIHSDDPVYAWRERMLNLYSGMPREEAGFAV